MIGIFTTWDHTWLREKTPDEIKGALRTRESLPWYV